MNKHLLRMFKSKKVAAAVLATVMAGSYSYSALAAEPEVDEQGRTVHHVQIIEDENWGSDQKDYWLDSGIRDKRSKKYNFDSDILISVDANDELAYDTCEWSRVVRGIAWAGDTDGTINMNGHRLDINVFGPHEYNIFGMQVSSGGLTIDNVKGMDIIVKDASNANGLVVVGTANCGAWYNGDGSPRLTINNQGGWENAVKIRFENCDFGGYHAIEVDGGSGKADLTINGLVDAETQGAYNRGLRATDGTLAVSHTNIAGGRIVSKDSQSIYSFGGEVNINATLDEAGNLSIPHADNPVILYGNIRADGARTVDSIVNVGLNNADSRFDGAVQIVNQFGHTGKVSLGLANGAVWNNEYLDKDTKTYFGGSYVENLQGGATAEQAGVILQKTSQNLNVNNYSGNTVVIYEHTNNGTQASDYAAGNTVIQKAAAGSNIVLSTDNIGIDTENTAEVNKVLSTLAGKLYYMNSDKDTNLSGKVQIADGLIGSSKAIKVGDIAFGADHKGQYTADGVVVGDYNFTQAITTFPDKDKQYVEAGVVFDDGLKYEFKQGSTVGIDIKDGRGAILLNNETDGVVINVEKGKLLLNNTNTQTEGTGTVTGFQKSGKGNATVNVGDMVVKVDATDWGRAEGLHVDSSDGKHDSVATINGNVAVNAYGNDYTLGIYTSGNSELTINGNVTMRGEGGKYGVDNFGTGANDHYSISGIYAGANYSIQKGSKVVVNGNTDLYINGSGVVANGGGSYIELNGDTNIEIAQNEGQRHFAVEAESATVNINMNQEKNGAADGKVTINGNIGSTAGSVHENEAHKHSEVNIGLSNSQSVLHGVIINEFEGNENPALEGSDADINLYLTNGATWINETWGTAENRTTEFTGSVANKVAGGSDFAHAGTILQKDENDLTIKNYSGNTVVVYEHTGDGKLASDYAGGKTVVQHAEAGSGIIISTDSHDINIDDYDHIDAVLTNLAGKIVYEGYVNGEKNLSGKVQIADGLTASSKGIEISDITFNDETGAGIYTPEENRKPRQKETEFWVPIFGKDMGNGGEKAFEDANIKVGPGEYFFQKDTTLHGDKYSGAVIKMIGGWDSNELKMDAAGVDLNLSGNYGNRFAGILIGMKPGKSMEVTANNVNFDITSVDNLAYGIQSGDFEMSMFNSNNLTINGNVNMQHIESRTDSAYGIYNIGSNIVINGDLTMKSAAGSYGVMGNLDNGVAGIQVGEGDRADGKGNVTVTGNTELVINGNGVVTTTSAAQVDLKRGVKIKVAKDDMHDLYALKADKGVINITESEGMMTFPMPQPTTGDLIEIYGNVKTTAEGTVNLALKSMLSVFNGVVEGENFNLELINGSNWLNSSYGNASFDFEGSYVNNFKGGSNPTFAGVIVQSDKNDLTLNNFSGHTIVMYEHTKDGSLAEHYKGGNTIINHAAENSGIIVATSSTGINMDDEAAVTNVLNTLAGKLYYMDSNVNTNLDAKVQIADGLTSSSKALQVGDIEFKENHQGQYVEGSMTPGIGGGEVGPEPQPEPEQRTDFTEALTGNYEGDQQYKDAGVVFDDGYRYEFAEGADITITVADERGAIALGSGTEGMKINAKNGSITLNNSGSKDGATITGFARSIRKDTTINAKDLIINVNNKDFGRAEGISVQYAKAGDTAKTTINSNVAINSYGNDYTLGIYTSGNAELEINGNVTMRGADGSYGVDNYGTGAYQHYSISGIYAGANYSIQKGSSVIVNGATDLYVNGSGVVANGGGSYIELNGDTNIEIAASQGQQHFAVEAESAQVNINMNADKNAAADKKVTIKGNIGSTVGSVHENEVHKHSEINIGLSTSESTLNGVIVNEFANSTEDLNGSTADINLYISNGATWTNEAWGKTDKGQYEFEGSVANKVVGGNDVEHAGIIVQKDVYDLTINNYSGHNYLIYEHTGNGTTADDYAAGNTIINQAAAGSGIILVTDNSGIAMDSKDEVTQVLNTLAGKLYYMNSDKDTNLAGKVQIADGLTSSSAALQVGNIEFKENHQGQLEAGSMTPGFGGDVEPEPPVEEGYTDGLTLGGHSGNDQYVQDGVTKDNHSVSFTGTNTITVTDGIAINYGQEVDYNKEVTVRTGDKLTLNVNGNNDLVGINNSVNSDMDSAAMKITGKLLEVNVNNTNAEGGNAVGILQKGTKDTIIDTDTIIKVNAANKAHGIEANAGKQSKVILNGNTSISVNKDARDGYAIYVNGVEENMVNINYDYNYAWNFALNDWAGGNEIKADQIMSTDKTVKIDGDIFMASKNGQQSAVSIGLAGSDSYWHGVADAATGIVNLAVMNGATWINEEFNAAPVATMTGAGFAGSNIAHFTGGADAANAGVILQKDAHDITIDRYTGNAKVIYEHSGNGTEAGNYAAGNVKINAADAGAGITLITDNSGIQMNNEEEVTKVLNTLAGKLSYMNSEADTNLTGKVQIADGLTSSSRALQTGDIEFKADHQGQLKEGSITPGVDSGSNPPIEEGDFETTIMRGVRNIAMTNMTMWRDNAADMGYRSSELRNGAEEGIWARTYGGKAKYDANKDNFDTSYWGAQVGYDAKAGDDWNIGVAFNYVDGDGNYVMGGESDNSLYSFGAYATKAAGNGAYIDLAAKIGSVNGDYTVYNEIATTDFSSEYKAMAYSLSAEYGRRFGDTEKGYFEPQVQFTYAHVDSDNYTGYSKKANQSMEIDQEAFDSLVGRLGIEVGKENAKGGFYGRLSVAHEFAGDVDATYKVEGSADKTTSFDMGDTWSELTLGGHYQMSATSNFYIDFTKSLSGDYQQDWKVNGGVRFTF